jgi:hypothetical protein
MLAPPRPAHRAGKQKSDDRRTTRREASGAHQQELRQQGKLDTNRSFMLSAVLLDMSANASFCFSRPSLTFSLFSRHLSARAARAACQAARACQATLLCVNNPALQRVVCPPSRAQNHAPSRPSAADARLSPSAGWRSRAQDRGRRIWTAPHPASLSGLQPNSNAHLVGLLGLGELLLDGRARGALLRRELLEALLHGRLGDRGG